MRCKRVASEAGYGRELPDVTPSLNFYLDAKGKWRLVYIAENVRSRKKGKVRPTFMAPANGLRLRRRCAHRRARRRVAAHAIDGDRHRYRRRTSSASSQTFGIDITGDKRSLRDARLNIETYDFAFPRSRSDGQEPARAAVTDRRSRPRR